MLSLLSRLAFRSFSSRAHSAPFPPRSHDSRVLSAALAGSRVVLVGHLLPERKGRELSFFPLRDSYGTVQLTVDHANQNPRLAQLSSLPTESSVLIDGTVCIRPAEAQRPGPAGDIDIQVNDFLLLNPADSNLPFLPSDQRNLPNEEFRLRHRYLDLRRSVLSDNLRKRSQVVRVIRDTLYDADFVEVETPILLRSSPEGAKEFLVPTGDENDRFFALPQSPQQPKQILICSSTVDRYFQLAKCFRNEDGRKDRQPEFTQVDLEMAYVSWGSDPFNSTWRIGGIEVKQVVEQILQRVWKNVEGVELPAQFPVLTYHEAMSRFGTDKPDTRFGLEITAITNFLTNAQRTILGEKQEILECIVAHRARDTPFLAVLKDIKLETDVECVKIDRENMIGWLAKSDTLRSLADPAFHEASINSTLSLSPGDIVWLYRSPAVRQGGSTALGRLRLQLLECAMVKGTFTPLKTYNFLWITEFPLFTRSDEDKALLAKGRWSSTHHPFTAPVWQDVDALFNGQIERLRGQHYDLVLNGVEIGGGSVRIHDPVMQDHVFKHVLKLSESEQAPFEPLLLTLRSGAPPHGGIALGLDRLMSILCNTSSIRDVIAFPKTSGGIDLFFQAPTRAV